MDEAEKAGLSRRERQAMDVVYRLGRATAAEIRAGMPDPPGYSAVRAMLRVLGQKGHLKHAQDGPRYVYRPTVPREKARRSALKRLLRTFFDGSAEQVVAALVDGAGAKLSVDELDRIARLIERARAEGR